MEDRFTSPCPHDHPLADKPELRMEDLREETWIEGRLCSDALATALQRGGMRASSPNIVIESTSGSASRAWSRPAWGSR